MSKSKEQQLWEACTNGDLDLVKRLANDPAVDLNWGDPEGFGTSFYRACLQGHKEVVSLLLTDKRIEVNKPKGTRATPFFIACERGHKEVVSLLLADLRISVNKPTNTGATPFFAACQQGHLEVVSLLLNDPRIDINKPHNGRCTPLWMASHFGHLPVVQLILASGRVVDTKTKSIAGPAPWNYMTAAEIGRYQGTKAKPDKEESQEDYTRKKKTGPLIATLIDSYERNPQQVRTQLRK